MAALRAIYREVGRAHAAAVRARGRELVAGGAGDAGRARAAARRARHVQAPRARAQARDLLAEPAA